MNPPPTPFPPDDGTLKRVPDSSAGFTATQIRDMFFTPDWHPDGHPPMPEVVARGRKPDVWACGYCHRAEGPGAPENSSLAGQPAVYLAQQMRDYKSGARTTSVRKRNVEFMINSAKASTEEEIIAAADYFASLKPRALIKIVETETVPKTEVRAWHLRPVKSGEMEPIGQRIIEFPEDPERHSNRDSRVPYVVYVPVGAIKKGEALAATGGAGRTVPCAPCHGVGLKGLGPIPGIAGRSAVSMFRQLYDFKHGARAGASSALMKATVEKLTIEDMVSLSAYASSLPP